MEHFSIKTHQVHLWRVCLADFFSEEKKLAALLSPDEMLRAERFHFEIHRQRFIVARALLRRILGLYISVLPEKLIFSYGEHQKPFLADTRLQFNVSHSHDVAVYALAMDQALGVDIEKIKPQYNDEIANRFFSKQEYTALHAVPITERNAIFFKLWARKEALLKAVGQGLFMPLDAFTISLEDQIMLRVNNNDIYVQDFFAYPEFQAALATFFCVQAIHKWEWNLQGPRSNN